MSTAACSALLEHEIVVQGCSTDGGEWVSPQENGTELTTEKE